MKVYVVWKEDRNRHTCGFCLSPIPMSTVQEVFASKVSAIAFMTSRKHPDLFSMKEMEVMP